ncbi:MAG: stage II sporulation protein R, partial [Clostridia bacterium]
MKKGMCVAIACALVAIVVVGMGLVQKNKKTEYLRIHIRANSNVDIDQNVKYQVKNCVVDSIAPMMKNVETFEEAYKIIGQNLDKIEAVADATLKEKGFEYVASARLCKEEFPTRSYQNLTLDGGVYDALIIDLGTGKGDNWWCV